jgi:hypothetical protein
MVRRLNWWPQKPSRLKSSLSIILGVFGLLILSGIGYLWIGKSQLTPGALNAGVTFSVPYAKELGLNWRETLTAALDDLHIRSFRIPAYWSEIQPTDEQQFVWNDLDFEMNEIGQRNGRVTLVVGAKVPRWPECWMPTWVKNKSRSGEHASRLNYIKEVVLRYKDHSALQYWQVENESMFDFGLCPKPDFDFLKQEITLVRSLDPTHQVATTDSGELSTWLRVGPLVDRLGVSTYRRVRTPWNGTWDYSFIPTYWYARRAAFVHPWVKQVYVSEFQMEPWTDDPIQATPIQTQLDFFDLPQMKNNFAFAERMQINDISFWGVEWWWWMKTTKGDSRFWDEAKTFFIKQTYENR